MTMDLTALRAEFVDVVDPGRVVQPEWRAALRDVPRDLFVPYFFLPLSDRPGWRIVESPDPEWGNSVLSNRPLITQLNGNDDLADTLRRGEIVEGWSTSSSSQPSLMVLMLEALDVHEGQRVLEVGAGSGYNAALLCHRLESANVTTIDVDPGITDRARLGLRRLGYRPQVVTADGMVGCPEHAPFDRIMGTVAVRRLPQAWLRQARDGGRILFPLDTRNGGGIMPLLTVSGDTAEGRFLPDFGGFMPVRQRKRQDAAIAAFRGVADDEGARRTTKLAHEIATDDRSPFEFFAALFTGGYDIMSFTPSDGRPAETWIALTDGSWVCHTTDGAGVHSVRQGGVQRLWDQMEDLHQRWIGLGRPERQRFGLTVTSETYRVWLDHPDSSHQWNLPF